MEYGLHQNSEKTTPKGSLQVNDCSTISELIKTFTEIEKPSRRLLVS